MKGGKKGNLTHWNFWDGKNKFKVLRQTDVRFLLSNDLPSTVLGRKLIILHV